ncbi:twin-arginine translocase subunit TatC [Tessaracoccus sp.]
MATTATEPDAKRRRLSWLRPPEASEDGTMALMDHLREVRYRLTISVSAIVIVGIVSIFFYRELIDFILQPYFLAKTALMAANPDAQTLIVNDGVVRPLTLAVIACAMAGVIGSCPIWMYQLWAFVAPGLVSREKKYALGFLSAAVPLFLAGCTLGYFIWPKGIAVMLGFTPQGLDIVNLLEMSSFLALEIKIILVFGVSFLLPVVLVALNIAGVVKGHQLVKSRKFVIFGTFIFAAVATPSTDPFSMLALSIPMVVLYMIAEAICLILDKRKGITAEVAEEWAVDVNDGK